jgi:L-seryl-tRNA(Ser) seleniumtransferase
LADASGATPELVWLRNEPGARQSLGSGADLVLFSGDKLLGGPQAGIIAGSAELVERCARHPMARALRPGSLVLSALQDTLLRYARNEARSLPFWDMALRTVDSLADRAAAIVAAVGDPRCASVSMSSVPGGGTLPDRTIPSYGVCLAGSFGTALRRFSLPIAARSEQGKTLCDLRTVDPADDAVLIAAITQALAKSSDSASHTDAPTPLEGTSSGSSSAVDGTYGGDTFGAADGDVWLGENDGSE